LEASRGSLPHGCPAGLLGEAKWVLEKTNKRTELSRVECCRLKATHSTGFVFDKNRPEAEGDYASGDVAQYRYVGQEAQKEGRGEERVRA
jgi:hypothetical protein